MKRDLAVTTLETSAWLARANAGRRVTPALFGQPGGSRAHGARSWDAGRCRPAREHS